jgi:hypothetical protein
VTATSPASGRGSNVDTAKPVAITAKMMKVSETPRRFCSAWKFGSITSSL